MKVRWKLLQLYLRNVLTLWVFCAFFYPQNIYAFELFGIHLWGKKKSEEISTGDSIGVPKYYTLEIIVNAKTQENTLLSNALSKAKLSDEDIKTIQSASLLFQDQEKPASGSAGLLTKARGDYNKILASLYAKGHYGVSISIKINGAEAADIRPDTELPKNSNIVMHVDTGPSYYFSKANIAPLPENATRKNNKETLFDVAGFKEGNIAPSSSILSAEKIAIDAWRKNAYPKAKIAQRDVVADHKYHTIEADIAVDPGEKAHFGQLYIKNVSKTPHMDMDYIMWMAGIKQGADYDPSAIATANARLARLDVFRAANIREADTINKDGSLDLNLVTQERPLHRFGFGGVYSTIDGAGFEAYWLHRNLFGHAERLRFDARMSGIGGTQDNSYNPENYSYLLGVSLYRPGVYTPDTDMIMGLKAEREVLDNYTTTGVNGYFGYSHKFNNKLSGRFQGNVAQIKSEDDYFGSRDFTPIGFLGGLLYDSRDNSANATRGLYSEGVFEPIYEAHYGNFIGKFTFEGRSYISFDKQDKYILAMRSKFGSIMGASAAELPSNLLFFAGGGGSVRGYGYKNIGVRTVTDKIIGGLSLVEGSVELRTMLTQNIGLVGFVDAGIVGNDSIPDFSQKTKLGIGLGGRYMTGLGPIRVDIATPLNPEDGDPNFGFYIGIGQAF